MDGPARETRPHRLVVSGREELTVTGVEDVERFDENAIVAATTAGTLEIGGSALHIGQLSLESGELRVDGRIDSIVYEDGAQRDGGLFSRLFG